MDNVLTTHYDSIRSFNYVINPEDNGQEAFQFRTYFCRAAAGSGAPKQPAGYVVCHRFELNSCGNSAYFDLPAAARIETNTLRKLANELDSVIEQLKTKSKSKQDFLCSTGQFRHNFQLLETPIKLSISTQFFDNGDGIPEGLYLNQKLILKAHTDEDVAARGSAVFNLCSAVFTPEKLREVANKLDKAEIEAATVFKE